MLCAIYKHLFIIAPLISIRSNDREFFTKQYRTLSIFVRVVSDPECGNTSFSGPSGVITSPQFPLSYAHNLNCLYSITGGQQNSIFLSVLLLSLEGTSNTLSIDSCDHDWLKVSSLKLSIHNRIKLQANKV